MRRSNRSIEVFDISLMAVVTKAMGAFLVLMLLLMPYYSSGPVGQKTAAELAEELKEAQKKLESAIDNLKRGEITPEDLERLKRLLEETQRRLQQAQTLADRLKRENDQLNSQVARLENELEDSKKKLAEEKEENRRLKNDLAKLNNPALSVHLSNSDCLDVVMDVALWDRTRDQIEFIGRSPIKYNYFSPGHSYTNRTLLNREIVTGFRSNLYDKPELVILIVRDKETVKIDGDISHLLKKTSKACHVTINTTSFFPAQAIYSPGGTINMTIAPGTYAQVLWQAKVVKDKIVFDQPTAQDKAWLDALVAKAKKAPEPKPPPPKEEKPISKQEALAAIEKLPVPRSVGECFGLVGYASGILSKARVQMPQAKTFVHEFGQTCERNHYQDARKMLQAAVREAITGKKPENNQPAKPLSKQEALAAIEKLPVPRSVDECMRLVRQAGEILSKARVRVPSAAAGGEIQNACISKHFDEARKTLQTVVLEAITGKKPENNQPAKPLSKQEALAEIEKFPVPRSVGECMVLVNHVGGILAKAQVRVAPNPTSLDRFRTACATSRFDEARKTVQALAREAITGKAEENKPQPSKPLSMQEALAEIEKFSVPRSVQQCMDLVRQVGSTLVRSKTKLPDGDWVGSIRRACATNRFDEARKTAQALARQALAANKNGESARQQPSKDGKDSPPYSKAQALAMVDGLPIPRDPPACMEMLMRAMRLQTVMHVADAQSRNAIPAIRDDCATGRFEEALNKTKAEMHRALK
jgi:hypothetical protein